MFQSLFDLPHDVLALVTRPTPPPRPREKAPPNPMRDLAEQRGLAVHAPEKINSEEGRKLTASLCARSARRVRLWANSGSGRARPGPPGWNQSACIALAQVSWGGAHPLVLLNGEVETGVSVIHMTPRLDGGPILAARATLIGSDETQPELEARLAQLGIEPVHEAIAMLAHWDRESPIGLLQDSSHATSALRLRKEHGAIDWSRTAEQIRNQVRALKPWPGTYTFWHRPGEEPLRLAIDQVSVLGRGYQAAIRGAGLAPEATSLAPAGHLPPDPLEHQPGHVMVCDGKQLIVATGEGGLSILALQPAGKKVMSVDQFLRGYHLRVGDKFGPV